FMPGPMQSGALRADGGAYVASQGGLYGNRESAEIRAVAPDGSVDSTFGFGGTVKPEWITGGLTVGDMVARRGGVLAASTRSGGKPVLIQLLADGRPDPAFGDGGVVRLPFHASAIHVARGGDIVVAGAPGGWYARVVRFSAQGTRRRAFGVGGTAGWHRGRYGGYPADVASDGRGRIYVLFADGARPRNGVLAFTRGGRRVNRFGRRGLAWLPRVRRDLGAYEGNDLVVDRGGLLVVGSHHVDGYYHAAFGSGDREDISAYETRLRVWRLDR
ncbi:MAG: hypothetical protein M3320_02665, partial [Actinomycetota bacterium]|nr:hypothetical protein [Actinomycetota bacterium]